MRRSLIVAGLAVAVAVPSAASARDACQQRAHERKVAGTVIGAGVGALVGNAINRGEGAVIGGIGGAVVGNNLARIKCDRGRTVYRSSHSRSRADRAEARRDYRLASNAGPRGCFYENRRYYDERGQPFYAPVQVCR